MFQTYGVSTALIDAYNYMNDGVTVLCLLVVGFPSEINETSQTLCDEVSKVDCSLDV